MKIIILAAGRGSRMGERTNNLPKCMCKLLGKPLLVRCLETLEKANIKKEDICIKRLFGSSDPVVTSRLQFQDILLSDKSIEELKDAEFDLPYTEIKYENTIDRTTGIANPRQLERVPAGSEFDFKIVYNIEKIEEINEDMENILLMIDVLEDDYLGGHGTRGYGRIKFKNFSLNIKTYTEENEKELASIKNELKNFEEKLGSKVK